ncbi:hypothetical protein [Methanobrevibacter ruminantium]|uniref:DISARM anti-phage system protein DrmE domain-containing protein n=1 Tax=Methanobrevibacter ruminantium TaxID=83816 RepID=UPI0026EE64C2|nr:hypothetical protein [Methanobrevibacter ruminantium]
MSDFKEWHEEIGHQIDILHDPSINLSGKIFGSPINVLSPMTKCLLDTWGNCIEDNRNLILNFPGNINTIPLLSYMSSKMKSKSTVIFSSGNINHKNDLIGKYNRNYSLLVWHGSEYLFFDVPIGTINKESVSTKVYMPRATRTYKQSRMQELVEAIYSDKPKILLNGSESLTKLTATFDNLYLDGNAINSKLDMEFGCMIFENADRYISSEVKAKIFIEWLRDNVVDDILLFFHFSNPNLKFLPYFKEAINALMIPFNQNILKNNKFLEESSKFYFNNVSSSTLKVLNDYNMDNKKTYNFDFDIGIIDPLIEGGNLDSYLAAAGELLNLINVHTLKNKSYFFRTINLLFSLNDLTINPLFLKFKANIGFNWRYISVSQFLNLFSSKLEKENQENRYYLTKLLSILNSFYLELSKSRRYGVDDSFDRIGKDYRVIEIIKNKKKYFKNNKKLLVGTYFNTEVRVLKESLGEEIEDVEIVYLSNLLNKYNDFEEYNLLLPGVVPPSYFSVLQKPFNKVLILATEGSNFNLVNYQMDLVLHPSIEDEKLFMDYFKELYDFLGFDINDSFFEDFNDRYEEYLENLPEEEPADEPVDEEENESLTIRDIFNITNNYSRYVEGRRHVERKVYESTGSNNQNSSHHQPNEVVSVELLNLDDNKIYEKKLLKNKKYLRFKDYNKLDEALEVKPEMFNRDDYVIVLESDRSFLDLYLEIFNEDEYMDRDFVDYWKDQLSSYIESNGLTIRSFYDLYRQYCDEHNVKGVGLQSIRYWTIGYVISPKNPDDLRKIGEIINDSYLLENYEAMNEEAVNLRSLNMRMGRKLSSLIKNVIINSDSIDYGRLSFEERIIYNKIKNSIYQVV